MRSRFVRPELKRLELTEGDWLLVKTRLTMGEQFEMLERASIIQPTGERRVDALLLGREQTIAYLVDWSLCDPDGRPVAIKGQPVDAVRACLRQLDPDDYREIKDTIDAHDTAMQIERDAQKKMLAGSNGSGPTSASPDAAAGAMSGSATSTLTSTGS